MRVQRAWWLCLIMLTLVGCAEGVRFPDLTAATSTPEASPTPTLTATPSPTAIPSPTPTPTPLPVQVLTGADHLYHIGDWEAAASVYGRLLARPGVADGEVRQATLGLAQTHIAAGDYSEAVTLLEGFLGDLDAAATPTDTLSPAAADGHLLLADALSASGSPVSAAEHYSAVLQSEPLLAPYAHDWLGDAFYAGGAYLAASEAYSLALQGVETASRKVWLLEKLATARTGDGDYEAAMAAYDEILAVARIPEYRSRIMYQAADTALGFGERADAYSRFLALITAYPLEDEAYDALVALVDAGQPVDEILRGLIDYHAEAYGPAAQAFYRVILGDPTHDGEPHYYAGLSFLEAGSLELALGEFESLIETHPQDTYVPDAWMGKTMTLLELGRLDTAVESYRTGMDLYPDARQIPDPLWDAIARLGDAGLAPVAAEAYLDAAERYPNDERAPEARFRAGLWQYRSGDIASARAAWHELSRWYPFDERTQAAWYWLGKTYLASGEVVSATQALSSAVSLGAWDFYGLQAADLLEAREPFDAYSDVLEVCNGSDARAEAEAWLAAWLELAPETSVGVLSPALLSDARLRRGTRLLRVGHFDDGRTDLEELRVATSDDPLAQYQLALYFRDIGLYRSSIIAAASLWQLSPAEDLNALPPFIGCLVYPMYYSDLVEPEAANYSLSPLFVYALLRQESLFEGYATSFAAAHGLMQVIPPTGAAIAQALDWPPDYETQDLYRPMVSVRFGIWYLVEQRDLFDGNLFPAMAGYNGGPGNALRWMEAAEGDTDLFVELIDFEETRKYVRLIREHFAHYRGLYSGPIGFMTPVAVLRGSD